MAIRQHESNPYKEYQIPCGASASAAQALAVKDTNGPVRVELEARGDNIIFKFGGTSVSASATLTSNALSDGNFSVQQGAIVQYDIAGQSQANVSIISNTGGSAGTGIVRLCAVNK